MFLNFLSKEYREALRETNGLKLPEPVVTGVTHQTFIQNMIRNGRKR